MIHVFALNDPLELRHTHLSRANGETASLPDLANWIGVEALNSEDIEVFPASDLGELRLSDYVKNAFDVTADQLEGQAERLDALTGAILIAPAKAVTGTPNPGPRATLVASLGQARADHSASALRPADVSHPVLQAGDRAPENSKRNGSYLWGILAAAAIVILCCLMGIA